MTIEPTGARNGAPLNAVVMPAWVTSDLHVGMCSGVAGLRRIEHAGRATR